jgi:DNA invertase Pin-like site-specific DNA recombinase
MRAVVYLRVSTDEQAASGLGLEAQRHACERWAEREGCPTAGPFEDDASGAAPLDRRPGLLDALADLEPGDVLLVAKRDRLGRDPVVIAMIEASINRKGCRVVSAAGEGTADDDPSSVLMRRLIDAFAEYERLLIRGRTKAALAAKRRRGERVGSVPFGRVVVDDGRRSKKGDLPVALVEDPAEAAAVAAMLRMKAEGLSPRKIARELDGMGVPTKKGRGGWTHQSVRAILKRHAAEAA